MSRRVWTALFAALWLPAGTARAQGAVEGFVTDATTGQVLSDVAVQALGGTRWTRTDVRGRYRLTALGTGTLRLRAIRVGYAPDTAEASLVESGVVVVDFRLRLAPFLLDQILVTASGQSNRRRQNGASVERILPDSIPPAAIQTFSDLITGRTTGLTVLHSGGSTGSGSRVRIRGSNSMTLSNEPLYLLDGVRIDNAPTTFSFDFGDESPSRLDEIDQDYVQSVDVVKGPAAAALYGTAAANGVIQLQTRQGTPGPTRWTTYMEGGGISQAVAFPANYGLWTRSRAAPLGQEQVESGLCTLVDVEDGTCVADSLARYNPLVQASPFRTGYRTKLGLTAGGGVPGLTYFIGGNGEHEAGVNRANDLSRLSFRGNLTAHVGTLAVSLLSGYLHRDLGVPQNGFTPFGPIPNGMYGWPFPQSVDGHQHPTHGYNPVGPDQLRGVDYSQRTDHLSGAVTASWRPRPWLMLDAVTGIEDIHQLNQGVVPAGQVFVAGFTNGLREENHGRFRLVTGNWSATAEFPVAPAVRMTVAGGTQYSWKQSGEQFGTDLTGITFSTERGAEQRTLGAFVSAQADWRDRVFLTGALRTDWSGGFLHSFPAVLYPAVMGSWVISDERFFPRGAPVTSLRLRAAYGRSGLLPGPTDALTLLQRDSVRIGGMEVPAVTDSQLGNPNLRPERVSEFEGGFDAELAEGRIGLEATYYRKRSRDALVLVPLAGSIGSAPAQLQNVGVVGNEGVEVMLRGDPIRSRSLRWSLSVAASGNRNRLISLGPGVSSIDLTLQQRLVPGYPLGGFWATPPDSVVDLNGDGMIGSGEVFFDPAKPKRFVGSAFPTRSVALTSALDLRGRVRLWAQLEYEGGHRKYNFSEQLRCEQVVAVCRPLNVLGAAPADKANAALAYLYQDYVYGYIQDAGFLKWRELGTEWAMPARWARWAHARSMLLSLAVRNVATWTRYPGLDPEASRAQSNFIQMDYYTQPEVRYLVVRLTVDF
jgi:TonB-dependent starch-binding outer membrane protein SusC